MQNKQALEQTTVREDKAFSEMPLVPLPSSQTSLSQRQTQPYHSYSKQHGKVHFPPPQMTADR